MSQVPSKTQKIIVNPVAESISIINAGPIGPRGDVGPSEASLVLTSDGQLLTRASGLLVPITRADLAGDAAFTDRYIEKTLLTVDGQILSRVGGVPAPITRASLAGDTAFSSRYAAATQGAGAPAGTGNNADWYYDTTNDRMYMSDGTGWIIMYEPVQSYTSGLLTASTTNPTLGTGGRQEGYYQRSNGRILVGWYIAFGTSGTNAGSGTYRLNSPVAIKGRRGSSQVGLGVVPGELFMYNGTNAYWNVSRLFVNPTNSTFVTVSYADYNGSLTNLTATTPYAWGVGMELEGWMWAEMNTPYL